MRKILALIAIAGLAGASFAETDYLALPEIRKVESELTASIAVVSSAASAAQSTANAAVPKASLAQVYTGATAIATTAYTPAFVGQLLIGKVSNTLHVAEGATTNDWIEIK